MKDLCSICESFRTAPVVQKNQMRAQYVAHNLEKTTFQELKDEIKRNAEDEALQLLTSSKSSNSKLQLGKMYFTSWYTIFWTLLCFEHVTKEGFRFLLYQAIIFADGCPGKNKNSILPSVLYFVSHDSVNIKKVLLLYFEIHHGQNKGDSMHSVTERAEKSAEENFLCFNSSPWSEWHVSNQGFTIC